MSELVDYLFGAASFVPHGYCLLWRPDLVAMHAVADGATALAYFSIPAVIHIFFSRRPDLNYGWLAWLFIGFITACGLTHAIGLVTLWQPIYGLEGLVKLGTAGLSVATATLMWPLLPRALALPSSSQLRAANDDLQAEVRQRQKADADLRHAHQELEHRVAERTRQLLEANEKLARTNAGHERALLRLQSILDNTVDGLITISETGKVEDYNQACERIFGYAADDVVGHNISMLMNSTDARQHDGYLQSYLASDAARIIGIGREVEGRRKDGSLVPIELSVGEIRLGGGRLFSGILRDISERKQAEHRQQLLMAELDHRVKNILANIGAMAHQTKASATSVDAYVTDLEGRIFALAAAQNLLSQTRWRGARLARLVDDAVNAFVDSRPDCFTVSGDDVVLRPTAAQSLVLALHELATNATKYGALSAPKGRVVIEWALATSEGKRCLRLEWRETGGPTVQPPTHSGFGMTVIKGFLMADLGASVALTLDPEGARCVIELPARQLVDDGMTEGSEARSKRDVLPATQRRILVVEDSSVICLEIAATLRQKGFEMIGPAATVTSAMMLLDQQSVDAAVLDLNLDGENAQPIAERLQSQSIPYVLATGYDPLTVLPSHLSNTPCVRKPFRRRELADALAELLRADS